METFFATPQRDSQQEVSRQAALASSNPVINAVMLSVQGLLAVLNEHRQIVSVNETLLNTLGIQDPAEVFGKRPGEALDCVHSKEMPGGCGTSRHCKSCGAVISIVSSMELNAPVDEQCVVSCGEPYNTKDHRFTVRAAPITIEDHRFVLFFLRETTDDNRREMLERTFFHDVGNVVSGLGMATELLGDRGGIEHDIKVLIEQLRMEIQIQQILSEHGRRQVRLEPQRINLRDLLSDLRKIISFHPSAKERSIKVTNMIGPLEFSSSPIVIQRILLNMFINALEATRAHEEISLSVSLNAKSLLFRVHNPGHIEENIAIRIFNQQISTKRGKGRGLGTYSMKLLGEEVLNGQVGFTTSREQGTGFYLVLPLTDPANA